jgi:hypothetical protein
LYSSLYKKYEAQVDIVKKYGSELNLYLTNGYDIHKKKLMDMIIYGSQVRMIEELHLAS